MPSLMFDPYDSEESARKALVRFASAVFSTPPGLIWAEPTGAKVLRRPTYVSDGYGITLIAISHGAEPALIQASEPPAWQPHNRFLRALMTAAQTVDAQDQEYAQALADGMRLTAGEIRTFLDAHKTLADGIALGLDVLGLIAGAAAVIALAPVVAAGATVGAVVGIAAAGMATAASTALAMSDGKMFVFDVKGDAAAQKRLSDNRFYRWTEAVGPLLLLPDLMVNFPRAIVSAGKAGAELQALPREIAESSERIAAGREALALVGSPAVLARHPRLATEIDRLTAATEKLGRDLAKAQEKLEVAKHELTLAYARDFPAWAGTTYGTAIYSINPPDLTKEAADAAQRWLATPPPSNAALFVPTGGLPSASDFLANLSWPTNGQGPELIRPTPSVWSLLAPEKPNLCMKPGTPQIEFRVAIAKRPAPTALSPSAPRMQFRDWDKK